MAHFGHANALRQAKKLGDYLIVGIHSDGMEACLLVWLVGGRGGGGEKRRRKAICKMHYFMNLAHFMG